MYTELFKYKLGFNIKQNLLFKCDREPTMLLTYIRIYVAVRITTGLICTIDILF